MAKQLSFTKIENELQPDYRQRLNLAESTEDVKNFFAYTVTELLQKVFAGKMDFAYQDVALKFGDEPYYQISDHLLTSESFLSVWNLSDLSNILARMAKSAIHRYRRIEKKPEKIAAKMRV